MSCMAISAKNIASLLQGCVAQRSHSWMHTLPLFSTFCSDSTHDVLGPSCTENTAFCARTAGCKVIWTHARTHQHMWASTAQIHTYFSMQARAETVSIVGQ